MIVYHFDSAQFEISPQVSPARLDLFPLDSGVIPTNQCELLGHMTVRGDLSWRYHH